MKKDNTAEENKGKGWLNYLAIFLADFVVLAAAASVAVALTLSSSDDSEAEDLDEQITEFDLESSFESFVYFETADYLPSLRLNTCVALSLIFDDKSICFDGVLFSCLDGFPGATEDCQACNIFEA